MPGKMKARKSKRNKKNTPSKQAARRKKPARKKRPAAKKSPVVRTTLVESVELDVVSSAPEPQEPVLDDDFPPDIGGSE
jgi:hypothetical protein